MLRSSQNIQYNAKLQKRPNYNELHRLDVETIKNVELRRKTFKQRKSTKVIKIQLLASIRRRKDKKCRVKSQNIQNNAKLQKWSYYDEFASIWRQNDQKMLSYVAKHSKQHLNYKSNQITMTCIDLMSKTSKQRKTTNTIKLRRFASIWRQNDLNNAKLQKRWNYDEFASIWRQND